MKQEYTLEPGAEIRALTIWQPWATLLARNVKRCETRSWAPPDEAVGQLLALHSARRWKADQKQVVHGDPALRRALICCERMPGMHGRAEKVLPRGRVLAIARLQEVLTAEVARSRPDKGHGYVRNDLGDYSDGHYAWRVDVRYVYSEPPLVKGQQRLWKWETEPDRS